MRILCVVLMVVLSGALMSVEARPMAGPTDAVDLQFRQLERDIPSLYLVNGLHLSQAQAAKLAGLVKKAKRIYKGAKGDFLKKVQIDLAKGTVKVVLGKGSLGVPGQGEGDIELYLESGGVGRGDTVTPRPNTSGQVLKYKAPKK